MPEIKIFHVVSLKLLIESTRDGDGNAAYEQASLAMDAATGLLAHVTGREVRTRGMVLQPLRLIEPAQIKEQDKT